MKFLKPRKCPKKSTNKNLIQFFSQKNQKHVFCESYLERDTYLTCEFLNPVQTYEVQEIRVQFDVDGKDKVYTPDAKLNLRSDLYSKGMIVEVKRCDELVKPEVWRKLTRARQEFTNAGYGFKILTDADIQVQPRLNNLRLLYRYRNSLPEVETQHLIFDRVRGNDDVTIRELMKLVRQRGEIFRSPFAMIAKGLVKVDINKPITPNSYVALGGAK